MVVPNRRSAPAADTSLVPPDIDRASRAILLAVAAVGLIWIGALTASGESRRSSYFVPAGLILGALASLALRGKTRAGAATALMTMAPMPWAVDLTLSLADTEHQLRREYAGRLGIVYDSRSLVQIVGDLRAAGRDAWPATYPRRFTPDTAPPLLDSAGSRLQPLAGISGVDTVHGNEEGRYLVYQADERGFHNPPGLWSLPEVEVMALGDSFTHGSSVPSDRNLVATVRRRWPTTLNLGYGGNGPLMELASLFEFGPKRRPRVVLWMLCEANDIGDDLNRELGSELLVRYWKERRALQDLEARQDEIDGLLRARVEAMRQSAMEEEALPRANPRLALESIRKAASGAKSAIAKPPVDRWDVFADILQVANETTAEWGGQLYLVYLPVHHAFGENWRTIQARGTPEQRRRKILEIGREAGVPVIDLEPVFEEAGPRAADFVYPYRSHFTAPGYEALGEAVVARLEAESRLK